MMPNFEKKPYQPVYLQVALWLQTRIQAGEFADSNRLPSERILAKECSLSRGTINAAFAELEKRGQIQIVAGSGAHICPTRQNPVHAAAAKDIQDVISQLRINGIGQTEIISMIHECAWDRLDAEQRPQMAWVDCSPETLLHIAQQIESQCRFAVTPLLVSDVIDNPELLSQQHFRIVATTIEHYDEVLFAAKDQLRRNGTPIERTVISLTPETISALSSIPPEAKVAIVHTSRHFFEMTERYLSEFSAASRPGSVPLEEAESMLLSDVCYYDYVILPPEAEMHKEILAWLKSAAISDQYHVFSLRHTIDFGSLRALKSLAKCCLLPTHPPVPSSAADTMVTAQSSIDG